jgi:hypothetical protein
VARGEHHIDAKQVARTQTEAAPPIG